MHTHTPPVVRASAAFAMVAFLACGEPETAADHMEQHFEQVDAVMTAVIAGDLAAVKQPAGWLASHEPAEGLPDDWEPFVTDMQAAARVAEEATDIATAAVATGEMALLCGACHTAVGQGTAFAFMTQPEETGVTGHMKRHSWALDQLWQGLIGPSEESWQQGAQGLDESPVQGGSEDTRTRVSGYTNSELRPPRRPIPPHAPSFTGSCYPPVLVVTSRPATAHRPDLRPPADTRSAANSPEGHASTRVTVTQVGSAPPRLLLVTLCSV